MAALRAEGRDADRRRYVARVSSTWITSWCAANSRARVVPKSGGWAPRLQLDEAEAATACAKTGPQLLFVIDTNSVDDHDARVSRILGLRRHYLRFGCRGARQ